jgi:signal peptidase II
MVGFGARMKAVSRMGAMAYVLASVVVILDQLSKSWIIGALYLTPGSSIGVWGPLRLTLVHNGGVSFGLLQGDGSWVRWTLAAFELAVVVFLAFWVRRAEKPLSALAVALIMGGAMGNVVDRLHFGYVVDFVDVQRLYFPWVFNLADSAITAGVVLLLAENLIPPRKAES